MKTPVLILLFIFSGLSAFAQEEWVKIGDVVPDFTVKMFDETKIDIKDLRGKVVLINFWATWCPPCRQELKRAPKEIIEHFKDKDFVFLPIAIGEVSKTIKKFREDNGYDFPMGLDYRGKIIALFSSRAAIPRNYLIDKEGKIIHIGIGYGEKSFKELIEKIEKELAK